MCPARVLGDAGHLLGSALNDVVPPEAQLHLLNAQRELVIALTLTLEHHVHRQREDSEAGPRRRRPSKVEID